MSGQRWGPLGSDLAQEQVAGESVAGPGLPSLGKCCRLGGLAPGGGPEKNKTLGLL